MHQRAEALTLNSTSVIPSKYHIRMTALDKVPRCTLLKQHGKIRYDLEIVAPSTGAARCSNCKASILLLTLGQPN